MSQDRYSFVPEQRVTTDPDELARIEAENGFEQFRQALELIKEHVHDEERPYRLRSSQILALHHAALKGIHTFAGSFRNTPVGIHGSKHEPPPPFQVSEHVEDMCRYVNENWESVSAVHLGAYVLWRLNWIHPFADGNGRTARAISYVVMSVKLNAVLPGSPAIPDLIASDKNPYYGALEAADNRAIAQESNQTELLEAYLSGLLAEQLLSATREASGKADGGSGGLG